MAVLALGLLAGAMLPVHPAKAQSPTATHASDRWLGADKLKHFCLSFFIQSLGYSAPRATGAGHRSSLGVATATSAVVGVGKEWRDRRTSGVSVRDLAWDAAGAGAATLLLRRTAR
jgi:uncharacterized protein YfiM (DUF2279 family)